jgi:hypothetical protein
LFGILAFVAIYALHSSTIKDATQSKVFPIFHVSKPGFVDIMKKSRSPLDLNKKSHKVVRKCVSFDSFYDECPTLPLHEYTDEEHAACFFNDDEYDAIAHECLKIISRLTKGQKTSSKKYSKRGLERMTPKAQDAKDLNKLNAVIAVLETQGKQIGVGCNDPEEIAREYQIAAAQRCQEYAEKVGDRDARRAKTPRAA